MFLDYTSSIQEKHFGYFAIIRFHFSVDNLLLRIVSTNFPPIFLSQFAAGVCCLSLVLLITACAAVLTSDACFCSTASFSLLAVSAAAFSANRAFIVTFILPESAFYCTDMKQWKNQVQFNVL